MFVCSAGLAFSQGSEKPATPSDASQAACAEIPDSDIPLANTMQAKVTIPIEAAHLKPGKKVWVNAVVGMIYPGCRLENDAAIYGTVTAASASKNPAAELSIDFNSADCTGHSKQNVKFVLIGVVAPPDQSRSAHDAAPTQVNGGARQISDAVSATSGRDAQLSGGGAPNTVKPGVVVGFKNLKLEPQGGPQCSARLTSTDKNIQLGQGAVLLLAVPGGQ
ncbi:MAG: hypothetical protein C5B46_01650 [Proteobacteria bacterium]|nr:MAG: hypothetical protein C5B46_01650 [Pseudomonadota bacterium]